MESSETESEESIDIPKKKEVRIRNVGTTKQYQKKAQREAPKVETEESRSDEIFEGSEDNDGGQKVVRQ